MKATMPTTMTTSSEVMAMQNSTTSWAASSQDEGTGVVAPMVPSGARRGDFRL